MYLVIAASLWNMGWAAVQVQQEEEEEEKTLRCALCKYGLRFNLLENSHHQAIG